MNNRLRMSKDGCLTDCLKSEPHRGNHTFKLKNTKKWINLTKNNQKI